MKGNGGQRCCLGAEKGLNPHQQQREERQGLVHLPETQGFPHRLSIEALCELGVNKLGPKTQTDTASRTRTRSPPVSLTVPPPPHVPDM